VVFFLTLYIHYNEFPRPLTLKGPPFFGLPPTDLANRRWATHPPQPTPRASLSGDRPPDKVLPPINLSTEGHKGPLPLFLQIQVSAPSATFSFLPVFSSAHCQEHLEFSRSDLLPADGQKPFPSTPFRILPYTFSTHHPDSVCLLDYLLGYGFFPSEAVRPRDFPYYREGFPLSPSSAKGWLLCGSAQGPGTHLLVETRSPILLSTQSSGGILAKPPLPYVASRLSVF